MSYNINGLSVNLSYVSYVVLEITVTTSDHAASFLFMQKHILKMDGLDLSLLFFYKQP